jgi:hypothetical protein
VSAPSRLPGRFRAGLARFSACRSPCVLPVRPRTSSCRSN